MVCIIGFAPFHSLVFVAAHPCVLRFRALCAGLRGAWRHHPRAPQRVSIAQTPGSMRQSPSCRRLTSSVFLPYVLQGAASRDHDARRPDHHDEYALFLAPSACAMSVGVLPRSDGDLECYSCLTLVSPWCLPPIVVVCWQRCGVCRRRNARSWRPPTRTLPRWANCSPTRVRDSSLVTVSMLTALLPLLLLVSSLVLHWAWLLTLRLHSWVVRA